MNEYQRRVLEGRKGFLKLAQKQEKELLSIYEEAGRQVKYKLSKAKPEGLTDRYLSELDKSIDRYIVELRTSLSKSVKDGIEASSQIASAVQLSYFDRVAPTQNLKSTFINMFTQLPNNITKQLISGNYYSDGKTLDKRLWDITKKNAKDIDTLIKVNVAKGTNARDLAKQLDTYINPKKRITPKTLEAGMSKNISYQAQRFARTSLTHASTETYIQGSKMNPFCEGLKWNLSPSHSTRMHGKTDICDEYSGKVFKSNEYPISHPNCLCYPTQENVDTDKARNELIAWVNGEDNPKLDKWMDDYGEEFGIEENQSKVSNKLSVLKKENSSIIKERGVSSERQANGMRKSPNHILSNEEIKQIKEDIKSIEADESVFVFRNGYGTAYSDDRDIVFVSANVFPDLNSNHPRDLMSAKAALAHEYYGHRSYRESTIGVGLWNDEFRASYMAAKNCPNLSDEDRMYLILDAIERAKEAGVSIKYNKFMRRMLYGY